MGVSLISEKRKTRNQSRARTIEAKQVWRTKEKNGKSVHYRKWNDEERYHNERVAEQMDETSTPKSIHSHSAESFISGTERLPAAFSTLSDVFCHFNPSTRLDLQPQNGNGVASSFANMVCTAARNGYEFVSEFSNGVSRPMTNHVHHVMRKSTAIKPATNYRIYVDWLLSWKSVAIASFVQAIHPFVAYFASC